ncbi:MAG: hypothetical protein EPN97_12165 [Alphaproteobacteria bacterium]|nr:MAG: hypothetical protein EPN97_12165 [Alphaproteobacteria bacterium]
MIPLTDDTKYRVRRLFSHADQPRAEKMLLETCGDTLPLVKSDNWAMAERIRFAVLKLSNGNIEELEKHIREAHIDWRDVLVAAEFAERVDAHKEWEP